MNLNKTPFTVSLQSQRKTVDMHSERLSIGDANIRVVIVPFAFGMNNASTI